MRKLTTLLCLFLLTFDVFANSSEKVISDFLSRILGQQSTVNGQELIVTILDENIGQQSTDNGQQLREDVFVITTKDGKPCVKGNSILAITTGINWYLNHYAHINISWNNLSINDLSGYDFPLPDEDEIHVCSADYRYYLNYCTFSYSMSVWTWERWEQEIDWMALHGINMPLQIVGLDVVWKKLLTEYYNYTFEEANDFIAGPCFQAWWGMNNLEQWGGPNPEWWYERQEVLAKKNMRQDARTRDATRAPWIQRHGAKQLHREDWNIDKQSRQVVRIHTPLHLKS